MHVRFKIALIILSLFGFSSFVVLSFVKSVDCSQMVIDTYELHAGINIPEVSFVNCYYSEDLNLRVSVYDLQEEMDLSQFSPTLNQSMGELIQGYSLLSSVEIPSESNALFYASGHKWGRDWTYVYDKKSARFWAELRY